MDIIKLYTHYSVPFATEGHHHCRPGWVNTECPFCAGNPGLHLGYNQDEDYFFCWRCGWHSMKKTISKLTKISTDDVRTIIKKYGGSIKTRQPVVTIRRKAHTLPSNIEPLKLSHKSYLLLRGFNPDQLERDWGLLSTGPIAKVDEADYKHRIIAPIRWNREQVSFQGRDVTDRAKEKYKACPKDREIIDHQYILYGKQSEWGDVGICVEGITDVWRFGFMSFATFGIEFTRQQVKAMAAQFKLIAVAYDDDPQAIKQAYKLISELEFRGVIAWRIPIVGDPGAMSQSEADEFVKNILT